MSSFLSTVAAISTIFFGPAEDEPITVTNVLVTGTSPRPNFVSGVVAVYVALNVRFAGGNDRLYQPFMRVNQFVPPPNSVCTVTFHHWSFRHSPDDPQVRNVTLKVIDQLDCDAGSFSMQRDGLPRPVAD